MPLNLIAEIAVRFPRLPAGGISVPNTALQQVVRSVAQSLECAANLRMDIGEGWNNRLPNTLS